jgi:hypothetical protein
MTTAHTSLCQYIGEQGTTPTCTHSALEGHSYCAEHLAVVYKQGSKRAKRHKEIRTVDKVRIVESLINEAIAELEAEGFDCYGDSELGILADEDQVVEA